METMLLKLARQLNAMDEASLMALWESYAEKVRHFEPTQRWEEAVLVFSFLQAKRWKNQLFNYYWAEQSRPHPVQDQEIDFFGHDLDEQLMEEQARLKKEEKTVRRAKILAFKPDLGSPKKPEGKEEE